MNEVMNLSAGLPDSNQLHCIVVLNVRLYEAAMSQL